MSRLAPSILTSNLLQITQNCRSDMHQPDEQGLIARVVGDHLDNAFGERIDEDAIKKGYQEFVVILERDEEHVECFNLATLISLAREAAIERTRYVLAKKS